MWVYEGSRKRQKRMLILLEMGDKYYETPYRSPGNQTLVSWKSNRYLQQLSHLSSSNIDVSVSSGILPHMLGLCPWVCEIFIIKNKTSVLFVVANTSGKPLIHYCKSNYRVLKNRIGSKLMVHNDLLFMFQCVHVWVCVCLYAYLYMLYYTSGGLEDNLQESVLHFVEIKVRLSG